MPRREWVYDPHSGGKAIPPTVQERTRKRIEAYAAAHYARRYIRLDIRFRKQFCYIDAFVEPSVPEDFPSPDWGETREELIERMRNTPTHLCRLRYFGNEDQWSLGFYAYSSESYKPSFFRNGTFMGTPEEGFDTGAVYLRG